MLAPCLVLVESQQTVRENGDGSHREEEAGRCDSWDCKSSGDEKTQGKDGG